MRNTCGRGTPDLAHGVRLLILILGAGLAAAAAPAADPVAEEIDTCLSCHADKTLVLELPSGEKPSLTVDVEKYRKSVHGAKLRCTDCHPAQAEIPHPERKYKDVQELRTSLREACRRCHLETWTKAQDGVHEQLAAKGDSSAPTCIDCHGAHDVQRPGQPRTRVSETCGTCHSDIYETYAKSVHGSALEKGNLDVPVCTDCHHPHDIAHAKDPAFRYRSPDTCGTCHTDAQRMRKYGLSTAVVSTYLWDFHGTTASLYGEAKAAGRPIAVCTDCHGIHDIAHAQDPSSPVLKANLLKTCRKCHPDASESFPSAWLSHYEPSLERTPLLWSVQKFYSIFIPFIIGGLVLQVLLHLWRVAVNR